MIPDLLRRAAGNAVAGDPYYSAVSLLLHFNGANGSTTFTDSSSNNLTVTAVGTGQISTAQSKFGGASGLFGSGGNYATVPSSSLFDFGAGDFTIEFWYYTSQLNTQQQLLVRAANQAGSLSPWLIVREADNIIRWSWTSSGTTWVLDNVGGSTTLSANTWNHIAVTRTNGTFRIFINGVLDYTNSSSTASIQAGGDVLAIGRWPKYANSNGPYYIDDLRISAGISRYTANFTVPSAPYPDRIGSIEADAYFPQTSLLLHMDGTNASTSFVDSGPNALAVTASGNAQISTAQSKFGGASGAFDGTGDYLTATLSALGTGDFTIEFWIYFNSISTTYLIYDTRPSGSNGWYPTIYFDASAGRINYYANTAIRITGTVATPAGAWHHVALCRSSGSTRLFINGTQSGSTFTDSNSYLSTTGRPAIGAAGESLGAYCLNGYIDDLRVTTVARYTSNFTPRAKAFPDIYNPYKTLPVSGAALWLDGADSSSLFTDAGVTPVKVNGDLVYQWSDKSGNSRHATQTTSANRPTWVPPASGRNGLGALAFNGSQTIGSSFTSPLNFGTSDFTVECWIKPSSFSGNNILLYSGSGGFLLYFSSAGLFKVSNWGVADYITTSSAISTSAWTHVAVTRSGTTLRLFLNGSVTNTVTNNVGFSASTFLLGWDNNASNPKYVGQIQNLLVYNGQALYTANFNPWMS